MVLKIVQVSGRDDSRGFFGRLWQETEKALKGACKDARL
jgi:hypothetical protein